MSEAALVVVGTPIGNLGDLSPRATAELATATAVACEDTRRLRSLCSHLGIRVPTTVVVNEHTEWNAAEHVADLIADGARVVLVSDAGMPAVSDPGARVVSVVAGRGLHVEVVPGPSAVVAAIAHSGLVHGPFVFEGFIPRKGSARTEVLERLVAERRPVVLFEAPHRVARTVADLRDVLGADRRAVVCRELTKLHEEVLRATLGELAAQLADAAPRGEFVLVIDGAAPPTQPDAAMITTALTERLAAGESTRDAAAAVSVALGVPKRTVYELAVELSK
jgi:16S rRNA (cytidine1402-2'-O)-methyltransferase